jgi:hypothetical protein
MKTEPFRPGEVRCSVCGEFTTSAACSDCVRAVADIGQETIREHSDFRAEITRLRAENERLTSENKDLRLHGGPPDAFEGDALQDIYDKCQQYWNETGVSDEEYHAALAFIANRVALLRLRGADLEACEKLRAENERLQEERGELSRALGIEYGKGHDYRSLVYEKITALRARVEELDAELRQEWWWNHGDCDRTRYGDDGEMQCHGVDFKRAELDQLRVDVMQCRMERARAALEQKP